MPKGTSHSPIGPRRGIRLRIYPTDEQKKLINQTIGATFKLHNDYLYYRRKTYESFLVKYHREQYEISEQERTRLKDKYSKANEES